VIGHAAIDYSRYQFADVGVVNDQFSHSLLYKKPGLKQKHDIFLETFDMFTWIFTLLSYFIIIAALSLNSGNRLNPANLPSMAFLTLQIFLEESIHKKSKLVSMNKPNALLMILVLAINVLSSAYKSNITATFIAQEREKPMENFIVSTVCMYSYYH